MGDSTCHLHSPECIDWDTNLSLHGDWDISLIDTEAQYKSSETTALGIWGLCTLPNVQTDTQAEVLHEDLDINWRPTQPMLKKPKRPQPTRKTADSRNISGDETPN